MDARRWDWAPLPLRLALGFGMAYHGFPKVFTLEGHQQLLTSLAAMALPAPGPLAWAIGGLEFGGGILIALGALTELLSALFVIEMIVAAVAVHGPSGFDFINVVGIAGGQPVLGLPGYEVNVLYIGGFLALLIGGAGALSLDRLFRSRRGRAGEPVGPGGPRSPFAGRVPVWRRRASRAPDTPPRTPPPPA